MKMLNPWIIETELNDNKTSVDLFLVNTETAKVRQVTLSVHDVNRIYEMERDLDQLKEEQKDS